MNTKQLILWRKINGNWFRLGSLARFSLADLRPCELVLPNGVNP